MLVIMSYIFIIDNKGNIKKRVKSVIKQRWRFSFLLYIAFLFTITILARYSSKPVYSGIGTFGIVQNGKWNKEIITNIIIFIPYTFLYIRAFNPVKPIYSSIKLSIYSTVFIEIFQFLFWVGHGTLADVVHNALGGLIGCVFSYLYTRIKKQMVSKYYKYTKTL